MKNRRGISDGGLIVLVASVVIVGLLLLFWAWPNYNVWQQGKAGEARLREAEQSRKITIEEAEAGLEAMKLKAQAEVEQAKGVAEANKIIGDSLKGNEDYLRYLWIRGLQDGSSEVIYIPTEAGLPILEAGKRSDSLKPEVQVEE